MKSCTEQALFQPQRAVQTAARGSVQIAVTVGVTRETRLLLNAHFIDITFILIYRPPINTTIQRCVLAVRAVGAGTAEDAGWEPIAQAAAA